MNVFITNIGQLVTVAARGVHVKRGAAMRELEVIEHGAVLVRNGIITEVGRASELRAPAGVDVLDADDRVALPGFVDSHTHAVFAGTREDEFALRAEGKTYEEIAATGGGILSTVRATREATKKHLIRSGDRRMNAMLRLGTTTMEVKTGYGLSPDAEMKMLEVIKELSDSSLATVVPTFLGAHAVPQEFSGDPEGYVDLVIRRMIPYAAQRHLAVFCDVFCDEGYFSTRQAERILTEAKEHGLIPKVHADQLAAIGGTELAARVGAVSVDHLEHVTPAGIEALRNSSTVATVLPGASFFLRHPYAPARSLIDAGIPVAIATDFNPGSSMSFSMPMMMTIACTQMGMTPEEAISATTLNGAAAVGLSGELGSIEPGKQADIVLYDVPTYRTIPYHYGTNHVWRVVKNGVVLEF